MFEKKVESYKSGKDEFNKQQALKNCGVNVPNPIQIEKRGSDYYFQMEKIDGYNFREILNNPRISMIKKIYILLFTVQNVAIMHDHWFKHADLKPENIMVTRKAIKNGKITFDDVYLIDFDISGALGKDRVCTPMYKTFEHQCNKPIGKETDVQVLGMILYEVVFGKRPNVLVDITNEKKWANEPCFEKIEDNFYRDLNEIYKMSMKETPSERIQASVFFNKLKIALNDRRRNVK